MPFVVIVADIIVTTLTYVLTPQSKGLKGLDFSNSYLVPEFGHPLDQGREEEERSRRGREEEEEKRGEKREVILQPLPPAQGRFISPCLPSALELLLKEGSVVGYSLVWCSFVWYSKVFYSLLWYS